MTVNWISGKSNIIIITFVGFGSQEGLITINIQTYTGWVNRLGKMKLNVSKNKW